LLKRRAEYEGAVPPLLFRIEDVQHTFQILAGFLIVDDESLDMDDSM
jgi:hypothetical protein